ncbi:MAG: hypothetical protein IKO76_04160 [Butyrivibrio sp.]|nr:hypothetical protein [Butyrivibrio sp.]
MKKILLTLHNLNEKLGSYFSGTALGQILSAIILAAAVAGATSIAGNIKAERVEQDFYNDISIGLSRDYIEDILGHPRNVYLGIADGLNKCCYPLKHSMVTVFYNNDMIVGYFITLRDGGYKKIGTSENFYTEKTPLGSYTFDSLWGLPDEIRAGQVRADYTYIEKYYPGEAEDYNVFYYIYLSSDGFEQKNQYTSGEEFFGDAEVSELDSDDVELEMIATDDYDELYIDRKKARPNTFGKCIMEFSKPIDNCLIFSENY